MRRYRLRYCVIDSDGSVAAVFVTKTAAKEYRDRMELHAAKFAHPSAAPVDMVRKEFSECVMEMLDHGGEWMPYQQIKTPDEMEKAARLIGYGNNRNYYRVIDSLTGRVLLPPPADDSI